VVRAANGFVQADGRLQARLQLGVVDDVVVRERLLDHHQVKIVQPAQMVGVGERVSGVGVRHQFDKRKTFAHAPHHVDVQPGLIFILMR